MDQRLIAILPYSDLEQAQAFFERLEGVGVAPTIEVPIGPGAVAGDDPQLNRAFAVLATA